MAVSRSISQEALEPLLPLDIIYRPKKGLAPRLEHGFVPSGSGRAEASSLRKSWRRIGRELRTSASTSGANSATASGWQDLGLQM